jgi:hypothetical protein
MLSLTRVWVRNLWLFLGLTAQSVSGPSPAGLVTILYCINFESPPAWRARFQYLLLHEQVGPVQPPGIDFVIRS